MVALNPKMGVQPPFAQFGVSSSVSSTTFAVDSAFVFGVSGDGMIYRFTAPVTQTIAALTINVYASAKTGIPTSQTAILYGGPVGADDPQRPNSTVIDTSAALDVSATTLPAWLTFTFSATTLIAGATYFIVITNTTITPASNFVTYTGRPQNFLTPTRITGYTTIDGIATDPVNISSSTEPPIVLKFSDGTFMGNPYVVSTNATNDANPRGMRFQYDANIEIVGFVTFISTSVLGTYYVYQGATLIETIIPDRFQNNNACAIYFPTGAKTFQGGLAYDIVFDPVSATVIGARCGPGTSPPSDVSAAMFSQMGFVQGATPGSFTYTQGELTSIILLPNNIPAAAAGGSYTGFISI